MAEWRAEAAEAIGVFFLVLAGGAAALTGQAPLAVAFAFGIAVLVLVYALGHVSGAHFNPAITVAFALTRHFPWQRSISYVAAQLAGAILATLTLQFLFHDVTPVVTTIAPDLSLIAAGVVEALASFLLAFVIVAVATDARASPGAAGLAIGLTITVDAIAFGALTGASMNPARSLGPALVANHLQDLWVYMLAPVIGAAAGMATYEMLRRGRKPTRDEALGSRGRARLEGQQ